MFYRLIHNETTHQTEIINLSQPKQNLLIFALPLFGFLLIIILFILIARRVKKVKIEEENNPVVTVMTTEEPDKEIKLSAKRVIKPIDIEFSSAQK